MNANVPMFLNARAKALAFGDRNQVRAIDADLARVGYRVPTVTERIETPSGMETTAVRAPETATPQVNRGGRPPLPRCEHGKTPGRCKRCPEH